MAAPTATVTKVRQRLIDLSTTKPYLTTATSMEEAIVNAVTRYSKDSPRTVVVDVAGNDTPYFALTGGGAVLVSWVDGFSSINKIEYPAEAIGVNYVPSYLIAAEDWEYYDGPGVKYLRIITTTPTASETLRIHYTTRHTHTSATDTVPAGDLDALCDLAAYYGCLALATQAAGASEPMIQADSVNHRDAQLKYKQQAEAWLNEYKDKMGIISGSSGGSSGGSSVPGASANSDWDQSFQNGLPFITHWGRRR